MIRGHFLRTVSYLLHVKEPVTKGHLSCRDTFSQILRCPLNTGFTVLVARRDGDVSPGTLITFTPMEQCFLFP